MKGRRHDASISGRDVGKARVVLAATDQKRVSMRTRLVALYIILSLLNVGGWLWAAGAFHGRPALLGIALVVYGLGLRHAVDADHIAAIDNVTRKLVQARQRPVAVGFFFALGHSLIVIAVAALVATATLMLDRLQGVAAVGEIIGTTVSAAFLFAIGLMNLAIFRSVYRTFKRVRRGENTLGAELDAQLTGRGLVARLFRPLFALVKASWHMVLIGFLFGLGFDTATEVTMFAISAAQAGNGLPASAFLVFPILFTAGMSLADTTDGVLMLGAYEWAYVDPSRKLYYNLTVTLTSALVALMVGSIEVAGLIGTRLRSGSSFWTAMNVINDNFTIVGLIVIALFLAAWTLSFALFKVRGIREAEPMNHW